MAEGKSIDDQDSLEALLDEIEHLSDRKDDQRSAASGSHVYLNIYDMVLQQNSGVNFHFTFISHEFQIGLNHYISYLGLGAFHTGVEVYGVGKSKMFLSVKQHSPSVQPVVGAKYVEKETCLLFHSVLYYSKLQ